MDAGPENLRPYVLSYYKNYVLFFHWSFYLRFCSLQLCYLILDDVNAVAPCLVFGV